MFLVALAVAPAVYLLSYFLARDRLRPEPRHLITRVFVLGGVSAFVAALVETELFRLSGIALAGGVTLSTLAAAALIGIIEETAKFLPVFLAVPGHALFGATMGFNMGMAKFAGPKETVAIVPLVIFLWRRARAQTHQAQTLDESRGPPAT